MNWFYLILAGICEVGWPIGLKLAGFGNRLWIVMSFMAMALSGIFLYFAQKTIPMGTAYAIWTGIGAIGAFFVGVLWFKDPSSTARIISIILIVLGMVGLKFSS